MYSYIKGTLEEIGADRVVVDNHGIGYLILVPAAMVSKLPAIGQEVKLHTYLHITEGAVSLIGFLTKDSLQVFKLLLGVNGVGPRGALSVLSAVSISELRFAVLAGDSKTIAKAPGIGAKTAQRIILELKDKIEITDISVEKPDDASDAPNALEDTVRLEARQALEALGYSPSEALSAVMGAGVSEGMGVEDVLKAALKQMAFL